ncbi:MAG: response regulator transcription factor [Elusimicrobia bacterium]|nr:response regulator transcription factor [Elusimicrobiota bacterium]
MPRPALQVSAVMSYRLLAIGGSGGMASLLGGCASDGSYLLDIVNTGTEGLKLIAESRPDLALVDVDMPDIGGLAWLRVLRQTDSGRDLPVIVASGRKADDAVAEAFAWGADDFVLKECDPAEFVARVRAVLRRRFEREAHPGALVCVGLVSLDPARHRCVAGKTPVSLRPREFELLEVLMRRAGRVLSRGYLIETVWGMTRDVDTRAIDVTVSRLRKALGSRAGRWVETVERYGYRFRDPEEALR